MKVLGERDGQTERREQEGSSPSIRLTGVGTCGGGGWERGVGIVCVSVLLINDVRSTFARLGVMIIRLFDLILIVVRYCPLLSPH